MVIPIVGVTEAGKDSPLHDDQIGYAVSHGRDGTLPA